MFSDRLFELGRFLAIGEAEGLAARLQEGQHINTATAPIEAGRRERIQTLLSRADISHRDSRRSVEVLQAIAGAKSVHRDLEQVWTMPGHEAGVGHLTGAFDQRVRGARQAVTCATYNFQDTSDMWTALKQAAEEPGVAVTIYVDRIAGNAAAVKAQIPRATVFQSVSLPNGKPVKSHAKFIIVDHELLLLTSANFSFSAENLNVEFGLIVQDQGLAQSIETTMAGKQKTLYERI